jgi:cytochrome c553
MIRKWFSLWLLFLALAGNVAQAIMVTTPTQAQDEIHPDAATCVACHENLYLLHDSGKWYCLCETQVHCTQCHGGRTDTMDEDLAHEGMLANPLENNAAICQDCHPDDYQVQVKKFASIAGINSTPHPCPTCTPSARVLQPPDVGGGTPLLRALPSGIWQTLGASFLGIAFLLIFIFACRCWKIDQISKLKRE